MSMCCIYDTADPNTKLRRLVGVLNGIRAWISNAQETAKRPLNNTRSLWMAV